MVIVEHASTRLTIWDCSKQNIDAHDASTWSDRATPEPRDSVDSTSSSTPLHSNNSNAIQRAVLERRHTFSPKSAVSSLRQHLPGHGNRSKRDSVYTISGRLSTDTGNLAGPEQYTSLDDCDDAPHRRKNSVAGSLVGSIRGLTRRSTKTKVSAAPEAPRDPGQESPAEDVPLPSSPINIPSAAPVLGLDLGRPGMDFMPTGFAGNVDKQHHRQEDPFTNANAVVVPTGKPPHIPRTSLPHVPDEVKMNHTHPAVRNINRPFAPNETLKLPTEPFRPTQPAGPSTPMPGTTFGIDLDGADDSASSGRNSQLFERSVTPTNEQERKELRSMCSLDAIAEACSDGRKDSVGPDSTQMFETQPMEQSPEPAEPVSNPFESRCETTMSTLSSCPLDMPELQRQNQEEEHDTAHINESEARTTWPNVAIPADDPFDDTNVVHSGSP